MSFAALASGPARALESGNFYVPDVALDEGAPLTGCVMPYPWSTIELYALANEYGAMTYGLTWGFLTNNARSLATNIKRPEVYGLPTTHGSFSLGGDVTYINGRIQHYITLGVQQHNSPREIDLAYWYTSYHDNYGEPSRNNQFHRMPLSREIGAFDRFDNTDGDAHWLAYGHVRTARSLGYPTTVHMSYPGAHGVTSSEAIGLDYYFLMESLRHRMPDVNKTNGPTQLRPVGDCAPGSWYTTARLHTNATGAVYGVPIWLDQTEIFPMEEVTSGATNFFWEPSRRSAERWLAYHRTGRADGRTNMTIERATANTSSGASHVLGARNAVPPVQWSFVNRFNLPESTTIDSRYASSGQQVVSIEAPVNTNFWYEIQAVDAVGQVAVYRDAMGEDRDGITRGLKAKIVSPPRSGISVPKGFPVTFRVLITDSVDGTDILPGTDMPPVWQSSLDGELGWGGELVLTNLSEGRHVIMARAYNSGPDDDDDVIYLDVTGTNGVMNNLPESADDLYSTAMNTPLTRPAVTGVLTNDADADGDPLSCYLAMGGAQNGTVNLSADGSFTYTPGNNFTGTDYFYYGLEDGRGRARHFGRVRVLVGTSLPDTAGQGAVRVEHIGPNIGAWRIAGTTEVISDDGVMSRLSTNGNPYTIEFSGISDFAYRYDDGADVYQDWWAPTEFGTWGAGTATVNVQAGQTVTVQKVYSYTPYSGAPKGNVTVTIDPSGATDSGALWRIRRDFDPKKPVGTLNYTPSAPVSGWLPSGYVFTNLTAHSSTSFTYFIEFKTIEGWASPADYVMPFGDGSNVTFSGTYVQSTNYIPPKLMADTKYVYAGEGSNAQFRLKLAGAPDRTVAVQLSRTGDVSVTISGSTNLTFNAGNWDTWQTVNVAAAEDNADAQDGMGLVIGRVVGAPLDPKTLLTVIALDNDVLGAIQASTSQFAIAEGQTGVFQITLSEPPTLSVTVTVANVSGDTDISIQSGAELVFTPDDWDVPQDVTLYAMPDADALNGTATIECTAPGATPGTVLATEQDAAWFLPWTETFENTGTNAGALGALNGQNGWTSTGGTVTSSAAQSGTQSVQLSAGSMSRIFINGTNEVWISFWAKPVAGETSSAFSTNATAVFYVNTNGHIVAYSNSSTQVSGVRCRTGEWNKFEIQNDYVSKVWKLKVNGTNVFDNFGFYSASLSRFAALGVVSEAVANGFVDTIAVDLTNPSDLTDTDHDGLPDTWEQDHFGGLGTDPDDPADNGINTVMECYIAGLDPNSPDARFLISDFRPLTSGNILWWNATSGRVYTVYWTSNLLSGFDLLHSNYTGGVFTDAVHGAGGQSFYKIEVKIE
jgi:hypothetical protein